MPFWLLTLYAVALGAIIGSFLNVVIHRYPREESIVFPPSRCPNCGTQIKPWDNVPIVSWLLLAGRCRACRVPISLRYPLVELANGLFYGAVFVHTGLNVAFPLLAAIASMLLCLIYIDLDIQMLPDVIDLPGIALGLVIGALALGQRVGTLLLSASLVDSALGAALGYLILYSVARLYRAIRGGEGMGEGDMKMLAMLGAVMGWRPVLPLLFVASLTGSIFGLIYAAGSREKMREGIPFGVFLGIAAFTLIFFGHTLFAWYVSLLAP